MYKFEITEKGVKSIANGKGDWTESNINQMKKQCREDYSRDEFQNALRRLSEYARNFENKSIIGGTGNVFLKYVESMVFKTETSRQPVTGKDKTISAKRTPASFQIPNLTQNSAQPTLF